MADDSQPFARAAVETWLDLVRPVTWTQLTGGHSNFTFQVEDAQGRRLVLRRPPLGVLLPKAHDMGREWSILTGLASTPVPIPRPVAYCADTAVTGAPFYAMDVVEGSPLLGAEDFERRVSPADRGGLANSMIDTLAALHRLDPAGVGLGELGRPDAYLARQINTWGKSWDASHAASGIDDARFAAQREHLLDILPNQRGATIVHGDFGFHNCLIGSDSRVAAVVDWEICSLGDPLADLGYLLIRWPGEARTGMAGASSYVGVTGFPTIEEAAKRYAASTGFDLADLDIYIAFNLWKTAAIAHGVLARYLSGQKTPPPEGLDQFREMIDRSLTCAGERLGGAPAHTRDR